MADYYKDPATGNYFDRVANKGSVGGSETRDYNEYLRRGGASLDSAAANPKSPEDIIRDNIRLQQEAAKPAIDSLEASKPEQAAKFTAARTSLQGESGRLEDRYKGLIEDINRREGGAITDQTRTTGGELARRGITNDSGIYSQELNQAVQPIRSQYASLAKDTGLDREAQMAKIRDLITGLTGQETDATRAITNAIAQLQSGAGSAGIAQGQAQNQQNVQNALAQANLELNKSQQAFNERQANVSKAPDLVSVGANTSLYNPATGQWLKPPTTAKSLAATAGGDVYNKYNTTSTPKAAPVTNGRYSLYTG